jgi:hypothetical protein
MEIPPGTSLPPEPQRAYNLAGKPDRINAIILLTLISAGFNIFLALAGTSAVVLGTLGIGLICCAPFTLLPGVLGVFEALYAFKLMAYPPRPVRPDQTLAVLEICCLLFGNIIAVIAGMVALIFYSESEVRAYFDRINPA